MTPRKPRSSVRDYRGARGEGEGAENVSSEAPGPQKADVCASCGEPWPCSTARRINKMLIPTKAGG